jgi:hypothetical protein
MLKEWIYTMTNPQIIGNEDEWKKTQGWTVHTMDRPSKEGRRELRGQNWKMADEMQERVDKQLETHMQKTTHKCINDTILVSNTEVK